MEFIIPVILAIVILVILGWVVSMVRKVGPNEALIITGLGGHPKVIKSGGAVVLPLIQQFRTLSLELMSFDVASRDTAIRQAMAQREAAVARAQADQERVIAETASATKQAAANRDLDIARAEYLATVKKQQATADKAYEIEANVQQQNVTREQ